MCVFFPVEPYLSICTMQQTNEVKKKHKNKQNNNNNNHNNNNNNSDREMIKRMKRDRRSGVSFWWRWLLL